MASFYHVNKRLHCREHIVRCGEVSIRVSPEKHGRSIVLLGGMARRNLYLSGKLASKVEQAKAYAEELAPDRGRLIRMMEEKAAEHGAIASRLRNEADESDVKAQALADAAARLGLAHRSGDHGYAERRPPVVSIDWNGEAQPATRR